MNFTLLFSLLFFVLVACSGVPKAANNAVSMAPVTAWNVHLGDTVPEVGKEISGMLLDRNGNYWFASNGEGVYSASDSQVQRITTKHGLCSDFVWQIQEDLNGHIWFHTRDGFCKFDGQKITNYTKAIEQASYGALHYSKGGIFFSHRDGVCYYDGKSFLNINITPPGYESGQMDLARAYSTYAIVPDAQGNVWFGTQSEGVVKFDGKTFKYIRGKKLNGPAVRAIFQDNKGRMWFGNNGGGLFLYEGDSLRNITDELGLGNADFLAGKFQDDPESMARVFSIGQSDDGMLFVGTIDAGIWMFNGEKWDHLYTEKQLHGLAVRAIFHDPEGQLWFIVDGDKIFHLNGEIPTQYRFSTLKK